MTFTFKPSKKSNNGTDVNAGQVPQILFRVITHDAASAKTHTHIELVHSISNSFSKVVTPVIKKVDQSSCLGHILHVYFFVSGLLYSFAQFDPMGMVSVKGDNNNWSN